MHVDVARPTEAPRLMTRLYAWHAEAERTMHPLLTMALFLGSLLRIQPFQAGNLRLFRTLAPLLLLRAGYDFAPYAALSLGIEKDRTSWHRARLEGLGGDPETLSKPTIWIEDFLKHVAALTAAITTKIQRERRVEAQLPHLAAALLDHVTGHGRLTMAGAMRLTGASRHTLKPHLRHLVEAGHLTRHGGGRSVWYALA
jgi:Fic family protein